MHILIETRVAQDFRTVFRGFHRDLFVKLTPPDVPVEVLRFDGCTTGDRVHLRLTLPIIKLKQDWQSEITEHGESDDECFFVDEGRKLPFFLRYWKHRHVIRKHPDGGAVIVDDITYKAPVPGMGLVLYPKLRADFRARGPVYQEVFGRPE